jgi:hypothetical protein
LIKKFLRIFTIESQALRLDIGTTVSASSNALIRMNTEKFKRVEKCVTSALYLTSFIGVFYTHEELSMIFPSPDIGKQCGAETSDMELSCRRWSKASAGHII